MYLEVYDNKRPRWLITGQVPSAELWAEHFNRPAKTRNPLYTRYFDHHLAVCKIKYGFLNPDQIYGIALGKLNFPSCGFKIDKTFLKKHKTYRRNVTARSCNLFEDSDASSIIERDSFQHEDIIEAPSSPLKNINEDDVYNDLTEMFEAAKIQPFKSLSRKTRPSDVTNTSHNKSIKSPKDNQLLNQFEKFKTMSNFISENSQKKASEENTVDNKRAKVDSRSIINKSILKTSTFEENLSKTSFFEKSVQFHENLEEVREFYVFEEDNESSTIEFNSPSDANFNISSETIPIEENMSQEMQMSKDNDCKNVCLPDEAERMEQSCNEDSLYSFDNESDNNEGINEELGIPIEENMSQEMQMSKDNDCKNVCLPDEAERMEQSCNEDSLYSFDNESDNNEGINEELGKIISQNSSIFSDETQTACREVIFESSLQNKEVFMEKDVKITDEHDLSNSLDESFEREIEEFHEIQNVCSSDRTLEPIKRTHLNSIRIQSYLSDEELSQEAHRINQCTYERPICQANEIINEENAEDLRTPIAIERHETCEKRQRQCNAKNMEKESLHFDSMKIPFLPRDKVEDLDALETEKMFFESTEIQLHDETETIGNEEKFSTQDSSNQGLEESDSEEGEAEGSCNRSDSSNNESLNKNFKEKIFFESTEIQLHDETETIGNEEKFSTRDSSNQGLEESDSEEGEAEGSCNRSDSSNNESLNKNFKEKKFFESTEIQLHDETETIGNEEEFSTQDSSNQGLAESNSEEGEAEGSCYRSDSSNNESSNKNFKEKIFIESTEIQLHDETETIGNEEKFSTQDSSNQGLEESNSEEGEAEVSCNRSDSSNNESSNNSINSNLEEIGIPIGSGIKFVESVNKNLAYLQSKNISFTKNNSSEKKANQYNVMDSFDNESLESNQDEIKFSSSSEIEIKLSCSGGKLVGSDSCGESIVSHFQSINIPFGKENKPQKKLNAKQRSHMQSANIRIRKNFDRETDRLEKLSSPMSPTPIQLGNRFEQLSEGHISSQLFEMENESLNYKFDLHSGSASDSIFGNCFSNMSKCLNDKNLASNVIDAGSPEQASTNYDLTLDDMWNSLDDGRESTPIDKSLSFNIASVDDDYEMIKSDDSLAELMKKPKSNCGANNVVVGNKKHRHFDDEESLASSLNSSFSPKRRKPNTDGAVDKCVLCVTTKENVSSQTTNVTDDTAKSIASIKKQIWDWQEQSNSFLKPNRTSWMGTSNPLAADLMQLRIPDQDATMDEGGQQNLNILPDIEFSSMEY